MSDILKIEPIDNWLKKNNWSFYNHQVETVKLSENGFDVLLVAVGGGGLISGVGAAVKQVQPEVEIIGVEPEGAMGMTTSLEKGKALEKVEVNTIADSLGAPMHAPISFSVCQQVIDKTVLVSDNEMCQAMAWAADELKLALEPAGAAVLAAAPHLQQSVNGDGMPLAHLLPALLVAAIMYFIIWRKGPLI